MTASETTTDAKLQLAGMAMHNGVLMIGPSSWAVAVRDPEGDIVTQTRPRPNGGERLADSIPLLRGPVRLANMLRVLPQVRRAVPGARLGIESRSMLVGVLGASIASAVIRRHVRSPVAAELASGATSLALTIASMRSGELAAYHGAEHKAIGGYEQGIDAALATREHPRCGTNLALPMLVFTSIATQGALLVMPRQPRTARLLGQLGGIAAATELFRAGQRGGRGQSLAQLAARIGLTLQTVATTTEPTTDQLDVAEHALQTLLGVEAGRAPE